MRRLLLVFTFLLFAIGVILLLINKSYIHNIKNLGCTPYNVKIKQQETELEITWFTIKSCTGYIRYRSISDQDYKQQSTDNSPKHKHTITIPVDNTTQNLYIYVVSNNILYGQNNEQPIIWQP